MSALSKKLSLFLISICVLSGVGFGLYKYNQQRFVPLTAVTMTSNFNYRVDNEIEPEYAPCFLVFYLGTKIELMIGKDDKIYIRNKMHQDLDYMLRFTEESYQLAKKSKLTNLPTMGNVYCADLKTSEILTY